MARLRIESSVLNAEVDLEGEAVSVGRSDDNAIAIKDKAFSRRHFEVRARPDGYYVTDLGSTNGTQVNGKAVSGAVRLRHGDVISVGPAKITFIDAPAPAVGVPSRGDDLDLNADPDMAAAPSRAPGGGRKTARKDESGPLDLSGDDELQLPAAPAPAPSSSPAEAAALGRTEPRQQAAPAAAEIPATEGAVSPAEGAASDFDNEMVIGGGGDGAGEEAGADGGRQEPEPDDEPGAAPGPTRPYLLCVDGALAGQTFEVPDAGRLRVGRRKDLEIVVASNKVSGTHAEVWREGATAYVMDLGSTNGTEVEGAALKPRAPKQAEPGDRIAFGGVLVFELCDPAVPRKRRLRRAAKKDDRAGTLSAHLTLDLAAEGAAFIENAEAAAATSGGRRRRRSLVPVASLLAALVLAGGGTAAVLRSADTARVSESGVDAGLPAPTGSLVRGNWSFETLGESGQPADWSAAGGTLRLTSLDDAKSGRTAGHLTRDRDLPAAEAAEAAFTPLVPVAGVKALRASAFVRLPGKKGAAALRLTWFADAAGQKPLDEPDAETAPVVGRETWTEVAGILPVPAGALAARLGCVVRGVESDAVFDDVRLDPADGGGAQPAPGAPITLPLAGWRATIYPTGAVLVSESAGGDAGGSGAGGALFDLEFALGDVGFGLTRQGSAVARPGSPRLVEGGAEAEGDLLDYQTLARVSYRQRVSAAEHEAQVALTLSGEGGAPLGETHALLFLRGEWASAPLGFIDTGAEYRRAPTAMERRTARRLFVGSGAAMFAVTLATGAEAPGEPISFGFRRTREGDGSSLLDCAVPGATLAGGSLRVTITRDLGWEEFQAALATLAPEGPETPALDVGATLAGATALALDRPWFADGFEPVASAARKAGEAARLRLGAAQAGLEEAEFFLNKNIAARASVDAGRLRAEIATIPWADDRRRRVRLAVEAIPALARLPAEVDAVLALPARLDEVEERARGLVDRIAKATDETGARPVFEAAKDLSANGSPSLAEVYFRHVLDEYPQSTWAEQSRSALVDIAAFHVATARAEKAAGHPTLAAAAARRAEAACDRVQAALDAPNAFAGSRDPATRSRLTQVRREAGEVK
ncbi:MAG: FHA domain-containing protein [Planctomycetes bacterium]|nr:FHA domain-containing protein [Planctomycetota bacterium]